YLYVVFDANGKLIIKKENKQYESPKTDGLHFMRQSDFKLASYDQGFIKLFKGSYRFAFLDDQMNETNAYIKDYERVKRDFSVYDMAVDEDKKSKEEIAREKQKMRQAMMKMLGEYVDDLTSILGFDANKLYIRAAVPNSQTLKVDVIENGEYYTQITLENRDSFNEARIVNGKLLICYENDTVGPFVKVFDIKSI
ncbi:MAG: hypothetical protein KDD94_10315, partial [Calditrichaeota bacterium]|nr:hypothetical protein [Calditrichota bacterium]